MNYLDFLNNKAIRHNHFGKEIDGGKFHPLLFDFQRDLTAWACRKGRAAIFTDTGTGKSYIQLEWARMMGERTLIVAPLSVARQTCRLAKDIDMNILYSRTGEESDHILITNYEMVDCFDPADFDAVVLDESSILKALTGKTRRKLTEMFADTPYKLCCTATPAPNDIAEIANHAEFLGILTRTEMMATFFVHDDQGWRLKGHASEAFYRWLASWGMAMKKPSDLGYSDDGFVLPPLNIEPIFMNIDYHPDDQLFFTGLKGIQGRLAVRRATIQERVERAASLINGKDKQWIMWCGLNDESKLAAQILNGYSVEVKGSDSPEYKAEMFEAFQDGEFQVLVTKPRIGGFGMNFQNASRQIFVGLSDSFESYYQCIRRSWRYGQDNPVKVYVVLSEYEDAIWQNVQKKERQAERMTSALLEYVRDFEQAELGHSTKNSLTATTDTQRGHNWIAMLGDSVERLRELEDESIDLSVFSPPFLDLYTYSPTARDLGNSRTPEEFFVHFGFIIDELLRVTKSGRNCAVHVADIPALLSKDGYIGLKDFPGETIRAFESRGWIYHGRVTIDKNPQAQAIRTHSKGLLFNQLNKDATWSRPALGDYILIFRKPGENQVPVIPDITNDTWIKWAHPIWYDIHESDTLQYRDARGRDDDKHICPLQLGTIERCIRLWSNPGETILDPFGGIGSTGYEALRLERRAIIIELKPEYFEIAVKNLRTGASQNKDLFAWAEEQSGADLDI